LCLFGDHAFVRGVAMHTVKALRRSLNMMRYHQRCKRRSTFILSRDGGRRSTSCAIRPRSRDQRAYRRSTTQDRARALGVCKQPQTGTKHARGMTKPTVLIEIAHFACPKQAGGGAGRLWRRGRPRMVLYVRRSAGHESFAHYITVLVNRWHATLCSRTVALSQARRYTAVVSNDSRIMRH